MELHSRKNEKLKIFLSDKFELINWGIINVNSYRAWNIRLSSLKDKIIQYQNYIKKILKLKIMV